jgi:hypothetical protein
MPLSLRLYMLLAIGLSIAALSGGYLMLSDPSGAALGMSVRMLAGSPFGDFFIPGLILTAALGLLPWVAVIALRTSPQGSTWTWLSAFGVGIITLIWITAQLLMLRERHVLQAVIAGVGVVLLLLAADGRRRTANSRS